MLKILTAVTEIYQAQGIRVLVHKIFKYFFWTDHNKDIKKTVTEYAEKYNIFLDLGAKIGDVTISIAPLFSTCVCFEPAIKNYKQLIHNINHKKLENIMTKNFAIGSVDKKMKFFLSNELSGDNRFYLKEGEDFPYEEVDVKTIDGTLAELGINEKCIIKMDIQGAELDAMKGAQELLKKDCIIITEFWPWGFNINQTDPYEFVKFMRSLDYDFYDLNGKKIEEKYLKKICINGIDKKNVADDFLIKKDSKTRNVSVE